MDNGSERRQFSRVHLIAHGRDRGCTIEFGGRAAKAALIDISAGGARIKCLPPCPGEDVRKLVLRVDNVNDKGRLQGLTGDIRWRNGLELGVQFHTELDMGLRDLQDIVG